MFNRLQFVNAYGVFSPEELEAGLIAALGLTVYIKHRDTREEVRSHFFDVIKKVDQFIYGLNEIRPLNVDRIKTQAYELFLIRYDNAVWPTEKVVLEQVNPLHTAFLNSTSTIPPQGLVNKLLADIQSIIRKAYENTGA